MKMTDMKREKPKKAETAGKPMSGEPYFEKYPYCLRITLQAQELEKLGLKPTDFKVGSTVELTAQAEVFTVREVHQAKEKGMDTMGDSKSVELQITKLGLGKQRETKMGQYAAEQRKGPGEE